MKPPKILVAFATGGRPRTSRVMQNALLLATKDQPATEITGVLWHMDTVINEEFRQLDYIDAYPAQAYNMALVDYEVRNGELPELFVTMDDDCVVGEATIARLWAILQARGDIGLLGAWNDLSEHGRGHVTTVTHVLGEDEVQWDWNLSTLSSTTWGPTHGPFCVGGAIHAIPRHAIEAVVERAPAGKLYPEAPRREDEGLTARIRDVGMRACIARTVGVTLLPDDGLNDWYRDRILAMHYVPEAFSG